MDKTAQEQLAAEIGGQVRNFSEELIMREEVEGTDFTLVTVADKGTFVAAGQNMLTDFMPEDEARRLIESRDWKLLSNWIVALVQWVTRANN